MERLLLTVRILIAFHWLGLAMATVMVLLSNMVQTFAVMIMTAVTVLKPNAHLHHAVMAYAMEMKLKKHVRKIVLQAQSVRIVNLIGQITALSVVIQHGQNFKLIARH